MVRSDLILQVLTYAKLAAGLHLKGSALNPFFTESAGDLPWSLVGDKTDGIGDKASAMFIYIL